MIAETRPRRCKRSAAWNREWARLHVEAQAESRLSVQDSCSAYGLPVRAFCAWRRRVNAKGAASRDQDTISWLAVHPLFAEVTVSSPAPESAEGVSPESVSLKPVCSAPVAEVVLRGGRRLSVNANFDEGALRRLVALLESLPC